MSSAKKIGLFACTGVVAGNMMGSGIALLPANLASIGGIAIWGWVISIIGAMSLAYVYARLATKNPQQGGPIAYAGEISPAFGFQTGVLYYHANWIGNLAIGITAVSYLSTFFPILNNPVPAGIACIAIVWIFTFVKEGANKQVISSQADSLIKISRIWADFFPANTSNQPI